MSHTRTRLAAAIAAIGALAIAAPGASADTTGFGFPTAAGSLARFDPSQLGANAAGGFGICSRGTALGQGANGAASPQVCQGAGLSFIGPSVGQIASVIGPTIIGPVAIGKDAVSAGDVAIGGAR